MKSKEYVLKTNVVTDEDDTKCYEITRELVGERGQHIILVSLYPSYSASTESLYIDSTSNCLINHMQQLGIT